jgi:hypothetical protein
MMALAYKLEKMNDKRRSKVGIPLHELRCFPSKDIKHTYIDTKELFFSNHLQHTFIPCIINTSLQIVWFRTSSMQESQQASKKRHVSDLSVFLAESLVFKDTLVWWVLFNSDLNTSKLHFVTNRMCFATQLFRMAHFIIIKYTIVNKTSGAFYPVPWKPNCLKDNT